MFVALNVEQSCQISMIHTNIGLLGNSWFCVKCDAGSRGFKHSQIIGAITHGNEIIGPQVVSSDNLV
jgi:hypothetical protein